MTRPYVTIQGKNTVKELKQAAELALPDLQRWDGVVGITLNGGLARGYGDHLSEIDLTVYLRPETYAVWNSGLSPLTVGICKINGSLFDLKMVDIRAECQRAWESMELWDLSYAHILYDPSGEVQQLITAKLARKPSPADAGPRLFAAWWNYRLAGDTWLHRGDALQGHFMMSQAVQPLLEALFLINEEYVPHEKWLVHLSRTLGRRPNDWDRWLDELFDTGDVSLDSLHRRQTTIHKLWQLLDEWVRQLCPSPVPAMAAFMYDLLEWLAREEKLSLSEWEERAPLSLLTMDPFHKVVIVDDPWIYLLPDRLLGISEEDMYGWHYTIVKAVRETMLDRRSEGEASLR